MQLHDTSNHLNTLDTKVVYDNVVVIELDLIAYKELREDSNNAILN